MSKMAACIRHVRNFSSLPRSLSFQTITTHYSVSYRKLSTLRSCTKWTQKHTRHAPVGIMFAVTTRHNSSQSQTPPFKEGYIPEPPPIPTPSSSASSASDSLVEQLNALGEPTLTSLGLANYTPAGLVQLTLETLHVSADLPWWGAIVAGTVMLRIIMFPLVIISQKNAARMANHMPTVQRLQEKFSKARMSGNPLEASRVGHEMMEYMKRNKVNPMKNMLVPLAQVPVFLSVFVGIRAMAYLPVASMTTGGLLWFTDLTIPDAYYALPLMTMATFFLTIELGVDGVKAGTMTPMMRTMMRCMPVVMLPFIMNFPSAMLCYWFTSNFFSMTQVMFLKIPRIRKAFGIPEMVKHENSVVAKKKSFREGFMESWENSKLASQMSERERLDAMKFKEAGVGPLQKTYSYDPTKVKKKAS